MKSIKQAIGAMLLAGGAFGLFVACSTEGNSCVTQADCAADEVCDGTTCASTCTADSECDPGFKCEAAASGEGKVCKQSASNNGGTNNGTTSNNGGTSNNGTTAPAGAVYNYLMVRDTTVGAGCDGTDPGSDLMYINLSDSTGTILGYAKTVLNVEGTGTGDNGNIDSTLLDGLPPSLDNMQCIDAAFGDETVYSMGCGGTLVFKIAQNGTDAPFPIVGGKHGITIGEYGTQCNGSADDSYELLGCTDDTDVLDGNMTSCTVLIAGDSEGINLLPVAK